MFNYILSYDPIASNFSTTQLAAFIRENRKLAGWYSPFLGTYMLKSAEPLVVIVESFRPFFDGSLFLVSVASMASGAMAPEIWTWFNTGAIPAVAPPAPPPPRIS